MSSSNFQRIERVARNNAVWCDAVCQAHNLPGEFSDSMWVNRHPVPRFYPNGVTLNPNDQAQQRQLVKRLLDSELWGHWSVKDSFQALDLGNLGFSVLLEASWIWREPRPLATPNDFDLERWTPLHDRSELPAWELAWNNASIDGPESRPPGVFVPSLLDDPNVVFLVAHDPNSAFTGGIVAGGIAHRTSSVVGLSNVFILSEDERERERHWHAAVNAVRDSFPDLPVVGYERGVDLDIALSLGFETLGPLRIWTLD